MKLQVNFNDAPVDIIERLKTVYGVTFSVDGTMSYDAAQHMDIIQVLNTYGISWNVPKTEFRNIPAPKDLKG